MIERYTMLFTKSNMVTKKKTSLEKILFFVFVFSLANMMYLGGGSIGTLAYAQNDVKEVSEKQLSNDGKKIIGYCSKSLDENNFPRYNLRDCDTSMTYFDNYCSTKAEWEIGHVCVDENAQDELNSYINNRGLELEFSPDYYVEPY